MKELQGQQPKPEGEPQDGGKTWYNTRLSKREPEQYSNGEVGYSSDREVLPNSQEHALIGLTNEDFEKGMVVRPTTEDETKDMKFSYDFSRNED